MNVTVKYSSSATFKGPQLAASYVKRTEWSKLKHQMSFEKLYL